MLYAICVFIGLVLGVFATAICARGKVSDYEMEIYQLKKDNLALSYRLTKYENAVGRV